MKDQFLSSQGRIGRLAFFLRFLALAVFSGLVSYVAITAFLRTHAELVPMGIYLGLLATLVSSFVLLMQLLKRLRDMGKEAWLSVFLLVPGVNLLLLLYALVTPSQPGE